MPVRKQQIIAIMLVILGVFGLIACVPNTPDAQNTAPPPLAKSIRFHSWVADVPQEILDRFTTETGVAVEFITYESQDEAMNSLRNGDIFDVVVLNNEYVAVAISENRLTTLDYSLLTNFRNISVNFRDLVYDPQNRHSVPYNWGTFGIVINPEKVTTPVTKWADLWNEEFRGKLVIWNGTRTALGFALKTLGYDPNTINLDELAEAETKLMELRPSVLSFVGASADVVPLLTTGDGAIAAGYVGDIFAARSEGVTLEYILPEEGTLLWGDNFVIPVNSPNAYTAHVFVNFLLQPQSAATILEYNYYSSPNEGVAPLVAENLRNDPLIFPPNDVLRDASLLLSLPTDIEARYSAIWDAFVAGETTP
jgi:spermidine/putrescine transport system substrate-binding protein